LLKKSNIEVDYSNITIITKNSYNFYNKKNQQQQPLEQLTLFMITNFLKKKRKFNVKIIQKNNQNTKIKPLYIYITYINIQPFILFLKFVCVNAHT